MTASTPAHAGRCRRGSPALLLAACVLACARVGGVAAAQLIDAPVVKADAKDGEGGHDVYLNDSFEATDTFSTAKSLTERGRWSEAAEALQRVADRFGDHLVKLAPGQYVGVRQHVRDVICHWPHAGIAAYQQLFDKVAADAFRKLSPSQSLEDYAMVFERYFPTTVMADRAAEIAERALEAGDLALARSVLQRTQQEHPDASAYQVAQGSLLAILDAMQGRLTDPDKLPQSLSDASIRWKGQERPLREVIVEVAAGFEALRSPPDKQDWPIFAGDAERDRSSTTTVDELGLLWRRDLSESDAEAKPPAPRLTDDDEPHVHSRDLTMQPVVAGGIIYVQKYRSIIALRQSTGGEVWRFDAEETPNEDTLYAEDRPPGWDAVTVHDGRVYASLPGDTIPYYSYDSSRTPHELVCLNAADGSVIWRTNEHLADERFAEIHFDSSPLVYRDRMYVVGRRSRSFGFEDCYLYRLDADTGSMLGRTHVGSASTGGFGARPATRTVAAMHGDTIYVCSNLGSIAAVSAHTGTVRWLRLYDRAALDGSDESSPYSSEVPPWQFNPVFVDGDRLVVTPNNGAGILVSDRDTGALLQNVPRAAVGGMASVFGEHGDLVCGAGREVTCYDLKAGQARWTSPLPPDAHLLGRGVWADDRLIVPTGRGLSFFAIADGARTDIAWNIDAEGGNLLALPDQLIVAGEHTISVYVRKTEIWKSLRDRMAAAPTDPEPALELAELAVRSGEKADGLAALREADHRATEGESVADPSIGGRLFTDAVSFAESLKRIGDLSSDELDELFSIAARYPVDAKDHLDYRVRFADLFIADNRSERAMELFHQILRDRSLRELKTDRRKDGGITASAMAQSKIAALIQDHGPELYAPFEARAKALVESGTTAGDAATLKRVVDIYPNSQAAADALIGLGDLAHKNGHPMDAARLWSRAYQRYGHRADRPELMRRIADAYEKAVRADLAYRWLTKAAREYPQAETSFHGKKVSLATYRDRLTDVRESVEPRRPRLTLPLDQAFERSFSEPIRLLEPRFLEDPRGRWTRAFVYGDHQIRALDPTSAADLWPKPLDVRSRPELLLAMDDAALFATAYEIFSVDAKTGKRGWTVGAYPPDFDEAHADWEDDQVLRHHALHANTLVSVRDGGEVSCVDISSGAVRWSRTYKSTPGPTLAVFDDVVVYAALSDGRLRIHLIDATTGDLRSIVDTEIEEVPERVFVTIDGQLIVVTPRTLAAFDADSQQRRWQVRLSGQLRPASVLMDLDALYFCQDGRRLQKVSLDDGRVIWETDELTARPDSEPVTRREGPYLIITTARSVTAVDPINGMTLWQGTHAEQPNFVATLITESYVIAVDRSDDVPNGKTIAYFYDHRNASGLIPPGGAPDLGTMEDVRTILAFDRSLMIQAGSSLLGITDVAQGKP